MIILPNSESADQSHLFLTDQIHNSADLSSLMERIEIFTLAFSPELTIATFLNQAELALFSPWEQRKLPTAPSIPWNTLIKTETNNIKDNLNLETGSHLYPDEEYILNNHISLGISTLFIEQVDLLINKSLTEEEYDFAELSIGQSLNTFNKLSTSLRNFYWEMGSTQNITKMGESEQDLYRLMEQASYILNGRLVNTLINLGSKFPNLIGTRGYIQVLDRMLCNDIQTNSEDESQTAAQFKSHYLKDVLLTALSSQTISADLAQVRDFSHFSHLFNGLAKAHLDLTKGYYPQLYKKYGAHFKHYLNERFILPPSKALEIILHIRDLLRKNRAEFNNNLFLLNIPDKLELSNIDDDDDRRPVL